MATQPLSPFLTSLNSSTSFFIFPRSRISQSLSKPLKFPIFNSTFPSINSGRIFQGISVNCVNVLSEDEFELDEELDVEVESGDDDGIIDFEKLEEEARDIVRDYSLSLSRELGIEDGMHEYGKKERRQRARSGNANVPSTSDSVKSDTEHRTGCRFEEEAYKFSPTD